MSKTRLIDLNVLSEDVLVPPHVLKERIPVSDDARELVADARQTIKNILERKDKRLFVLVGPCSIHDVKAAKEYALKLKKLADEVSDSLYIVMRVYFEKPRTTVGWKGLINDPYLNDSFKIQDGIEMGRQLLADLTEIGLPLGTEALDPISPQYMQDFISWSAIGARTTESQTHREMASGLSGPIGFKNGTDGSIEVAINALKSASAPHSFLGINSEGQVSIIKTNGNKYGHVVLRGGSNGPNYDTVNVKLCEDALRDSGVNPNIMVDCSHANSNKNHELQPLVLKDICHQVVEGNESIVGVMIESNLMPGSQKMTEDPKDLKYGVSITDKCMDWETTEKTLREARDIIKESMSSRK